MRILRAVCLTAMVGLAASIPGWADLLGTSVTGTITIDAPHIIDNYGTTQTIKNMGLPEFGGAYADDLFAANFTGTGVTFSDLVLSKTAGAYSWTQTFTDTAFEGATVTADSGDTYPGGISFTQTGDQISFSWGGVGRLANDPMYNASFTIAAASSVPEPANLAWLIGVFGMVGLGRLRGRRVRA